MDEHPYSPDHHPYSGGWGSICHFHDAPVLYFSAEGYGRCRQDRRVGLVGYLLEDWTSLAKAPIAAVAIITFLNSWNSFLEPLIYLNDTQKYTIPLALTGYIDAYGAPMWSVQMAATTLSVLPVLIFFILAQQQVVESFAMSSRERMKNHRRNI